MTDERTRLLAELEALRRADELAPGAASIPYAIAEREAKLAKLDAEPDWGPAVERFTSVYIASNEPFTEAVRDALIAAAPLIPRDAGQSATTEALAAMEQARAALDAVLLFRLRPDVWRKTDKALATLTEQIERMRGEAQQPSGAMTGE